MNDRILSFRELIRVNESDTTAVAANDEIIGKIISALFREGAGAATYVQDEFGILGSLFNAELTKPNKEADYYAEGAFGHRVWDNVRRGSSGTNEGIIQRNVFVMINSYLKYLYPKKESMVRAYGGEGKRYPNLSVSSFDSVQSLLTGLGLSGDAVFGKYWKNHNEYSYEPGVLVRARGLDDSSAQGSTY